MSLGHFDDIEVGQVVSLGSVAVDAKGVATFCESYVPGWDAASGAPDALLFALWAKLDQASAEGSPQTKRLGVDALRWMRTPPPGELLRGRLTVLAKDPVGESKGIVIAQHDLLDEGGRLVFSCMTRSIFSRRAD